LPQYFIHILHKQATCAFQRSEQPSPRTLAELIVLSRESRGPHPPKCCKNQHIREPMPGRVAVAPGVPPAIAGPSPTSANLSRSGWRD
jgi:hypothetical protein